LSVRTRGPLVGAILSSGDAISGFVSPVRACWMCRRAP
jgi:hypothetical protein